MQICQINVLNNKINSIKYATVSKLHEYCNKFDRKSLLIIYFISSAERRILTQVRVATRPEPPESPLAHALYTFRT